MTVTEKQQPLPAENSDDRRSRSRCPQTSGPRLVDAALGNSQKNGPSGVADAKTSSGPPAPRAEAVCVDLREFFGKDYRLQWDESREGRDKDPWLLEIPCKYGKIYPYGGDLLCAYTNRPRIFARLLALPGADSRGAPPCQAGDELVVRFPVKEWEPYFRLLRARKKRRLSTEQKVALATRLQIARKARADWRYARANE